LENLRVFEGQKQKVKQIEDAKMLLIDERNSKGKIFLVSEIKRPDFES